jgi:hypothetical protein
MTCLVEDITIKIKINHCEGDSKVLEGPNDLRQWAVDFVEEGALSNFLREGQFTDTFKMRGLEVVLSKTGLYEAPETGGGDN